MEHKTLVLLIAMCQQYLAKGKLETVAGEYLNTVNEDIDTGVDDNST